MYTSTTLHLSNFMLKGSRSMYTAQQTQHSKLHYLFSLRANEWYCKRLDSTHISGQIKHHSSPVVSHVFYCRSCFSLLFRQVFLARKDCVTSQKNRPVRVLQQSEAICRSRAFSDDKLPNKCVEKITENKKSAAFQWSDICS